MALEVLDLGQGCDEDSGSGDDCDCYDSGGDCDTDTSGSECDNDVNDYEDD